jgi:hypothetical protein
MVVVQFEKILTPDLINRLYKEAKKDLKLGKRMDKILKKYPIKSR